MGKGGIHTLRPLFPTLSAHALGAGSRFLSASISCKYPEVGVSDSHAAFLLGTCGPTSPPQRNLPEGAICPPCLPIHQPIKRCPPPRPHPALDEKLSGRDPLTLGLSSAKACGDLGCGSISTSCGATPASPPCPASQGDGPSGGCDSFSCPAIDPCPAIAIDPSPSSEGQRAS